MNPPIELPTSGTGPSSSTPQSALTSVP